jgi:hypothetical protein
MATDQRTLTGTFTVDADFRSWGSGLSAQFAAIGLVKTADTGQIDWATVLKPTASAQQRGYEIWRFNDALQATKPVFIRIDYGSGQVTSAPGLWVTVGTGTNGAGTLTGQVGTTRAASAGSAIASATSYCSGSSSRLNLATNTNAAAVVMVICVERTKNGAGVDTGDGIIRLSYANSDGFRYQLVPFIGAIAVDVVLNPALDSNVGGVSSLGTDVMLSPTVSFYGKPLFASWCAYKTAEITALTPINFAHLGATRTYMPFGAIVSTAALVVTNASGYSLAMLWE